MENILEENLTAGLAAWGLSVDTRALRRFQRYYEALMEKNRVMNLTAIEGEADTARLHFLDSLSPLLLFPLEEKSVIDVGTGAGFPGLPLKIACPGMSLTLLDSQKKRVDFLWETCTSLELEDVECLHARAEECTALLRESFDFALSRAVARLNVLCELCLPLVKVGGVFLALKGPAVSEELEEARRAVTLLGGEVEQIFPYTLPGEETGHSIAVIRKTSSTPKKFPRRFAQIKKAPL